MGRARLTHEDYVQKVYDKHGDNITILSEYTTQLGDITYRHNPCGRVHTKRAGGLMTMKFGCDPCAREYSNQLATWTNDKFLSEVAKSKESNEYTFLEEYIGYDDKMDVRHDICGHKYKISPNEFLRLGSRCPVCSRKKVAKKKTLKHEDWVTRIDRHLGEDYELLDDYKNAKTKIRVRHKSCGTVFSKSPADLERIVKCTICPGEKRMTNGEVEVAEWLSAHGFEYDHEVTFEDCYHILPLRFDFAILDDEHSVQTLIEFNGRQHYEPIEYFGGQETYELTVLRDNIKKEYAENNGIPLITIRYNEDVDTVLSTLISR